MPDWEARQKGISRYPQRAAIVAPTPEAVEGVLLLQKAITTAQVGQNDPKSGTGGSGVCQLRTAGGFSFRCAKGCAGSITAARRPRVRFQYAVIAIDLAIIAFFIATPVLQDEPSFLWLITPLRRCSVLDLVVRALASRDMRRWLMQPRIWIDCFILLTLLLPTTLANLGFLRIVRLWLMSRSGFLWRPLDHFGFGLWRDTGRSFVNLITFLFVVTGFLYTFFFRKGEGFADYIDALYFTVATATTTGFGDIVALCKVHQLQSFTYAEGSACFQTKARGCRAGFAIRAV